MPRMKNCAMMKAAPGILLVLILLLFIPAAAFPGEPGTRDPDVKGGPVIEDREVSRAPGLSLASTLALDFTLPGGGHFYRGDYANGFLFMSLKLAGAYSLYYFNARKESAESDLRDVRRGDAGEAAVGRRELRSDRAAQLVTFSVIGNLMIYFLSAAVNYSKVMKVNENASPSFDITSSMNGRYGNDSSVAVKFTMRI